MTYYLSGLTSCWNKLHSLNYASSLTLQIFAMLYMWKGYSMMNYMDNCRMIENGRR